MIKHTIMIAAMFASSNPETRLCNLQCTNHDKNVVRVSSPDIMEDPKYNDGLESGYILLCNGEAEGFTNHNTGDIVCDGTNHECSVGNTCKDGEGECYVCY